MTMFGIGPTELIVILVIALLVLGPKRLPELAAGLGKGLAEFRRATSDINAELDEARRAVEEPAREASRTTQPEKRVSRGARRAERPTRFGASGEASEAEASEAEASSGEQTAPDPAGIDDDSGPTPKAPA